MEIERFESLAAAYGGDIRRWPADEQAAALTLQARDPEAARAALAAADHLDVMLDAWRAEAPSAALRERVLASAPKARAARPGIGFWLGGAGFAAAAMAGVVFGMAASDAVVANERADAVLSATLPADSVVDMPLTVGAFGGREA